VNSEQYEKVLAINLKSAFFGRQIAAQQMIKQGVVAASSTSLRCAGCRVVRRACLTVLFGYSVPQLFPDFFMISMGCGDDLRTPFE